MRQSIENIIEGNPLITLNEINTVLRNNLPNKPHVCISTLGNSINRMLYTVKAVNDVPERRNSNDTKEKRRNYAMAMAVNGNIYVIYIWMNAVTIFGHVEIVEEL